MSTYNGWTNYATWRVNLEIFDGLTLRDIIGYGLPTTTEARDALQEYAEQLIEDTSEPGPARDYAFAFLSEVNWWEIADHMIANAAIDEDDETEDDEEGSE